MIEEIYKADSNRYDNGMLYRRCGRSGVMLPEVSLGFWHNFGAVDPLQRSRDITRYAFDHGVTHFDLANNYGPPYGSAEETFGKLMSKSVNIMPSAVFFLESFLAFMAATALVSRMAGSSMFRTEST